MARAASILLLACLTGSAAAAPVVVKQLERSYELSLADVRMPSNTAGAVSFKTCASCALEQMLVDSETRYFSEGAPLPLADFLDVVQGYLQSPSTVDGIYVGIHYEIESERVTRIRIEDLRR